MKKNPTTIIIVALITLLSVNIINAQTWTPVGSPIPGTNTSISALEVYNNKLIVGGNFNTAGTITTNHIAAWDGSNWSNPFGSGITEAGGSGGQVNKMCVYNNKLVVAGSFDLVGGISARNLAEWDGTNWTSPFGIASGSIKDILVFNGELYVAHSGQLLSSDNSFGHGVKKWNGTSWSSLGTGISGFIQDLEVYNGELYMSGDFTVPTNHIAKWNGTSWISVGLGLSNSGSSMQTFNGKLYLYEFTATNGLKVWDGSSISVVPTPTPVTPGMINLSLYNNQLVIGGYSSTCYYCQPSFYDGSTFTSIPLSIFTTPISSITYEKAFKVYNGELYAAWDASASDQHYNFIARLNNPIAVNDKIKTESELKVFPNPTQNSLNIDLPIQNEEMTIELINSLGVSVYKTKESKPKLVVNTSSFSNGIYIVKVSTIKSVMFSKFIKE